MTYEAFNRQVMVSLEDICLEIFNDDTSTIKIKNPKIGVKKLVKIIEAALKLSNEKGFHAMSLRELCQESGMSMGGLYAYIESKDDLPRIIHDQGRRILGKVMSENLEDIRDPAQRLEMAIRIHLYLSERMLPWFYFAYMETRFFSTDVKQMSMSNELYTEKIFEKIVEDGCKSGIFAQVEPVFTASIIKAMLQDWYLKHWKYKNRKVSVDDYADFVISWVNGFLIAS